MSNLMPYTTENLEDEFKVTSFICMRLIPIIDKMMEYVRDEPDEKRYEILQRNLDFVKYEFKTLRILIKSLKNLRQSEKNQIIPQFRSLLNPIIKNIGNIYREIKMPFTKNDIENIYEVYSVRKIDIDYYDFMYKLSSEYVDEMKKYFYD